MTKYFIGKVEVPDVAPIDNQIAVDAFYPIGSLYLSYESTSPAELFGGEWTQITGRFLRAANDTGTGGADNVTLTVAQLASHNHTLNSTSGGTSTTANFAWKYPKYSTVNVSYTGSNSAHNNMPAYQNVYVWRRIR